MLISNMNTNKDETRLGILHLFYCGLLNMKGHEQKITCLLFSSVFLHFKTFTANWMENVSTECWHLGLVHSPKHLCQYKAQVCCLLWWLISQHPGFQGLSFNSLGAGIQELAWKTMHAHLSQPPTHPTNTTTKQGYASDQHRSTHRQGQGSLLNLLQKRTN